MNTEINAMTNTFPDNPLTEDEIESVMKIAETTKRPVKLFRSNGNYYCPICRQQIITLQANCFCNVEKDSRYQSDTNFLMYIDEINNKGENGNGN